MHKKSFFLCGLTCIAGIFGAFARWLQNSAAFEEATGLPIPNSLWSTVMVIYLAAGAIAFFLAVRRLGGRGSLTTGTAYPAAFSGGPVICNIAAIAAPVVMVVGGVLSMYSSLSGGLSLFELINGIFAIIAAIFIFVILRGVNSSEKRGGGAAFIMVVLFLCFRLIAEYRTSASDPVVWHFAIRILAVSASTLAYYYLSGYCFEKPKPYRTIYFSLLAIFLNIVTFADSVSLSYHLITAGITLALLVLTLLLVGNMAPAGQEESQSADE